MKNKEKENAIAAFKEACDTLAETVNVQLFEGCRKWYWVGDDTGGLCDFNDSDFLSPEDMVRVIEHNLTYEEYAEWRNANLDHDKYVNLRSWLKGCRHDMLNDKTRDKHGAV